MAENELAPHELRLSALRTENGERCAAQLRDAGASTIAELSASTGLSRPTVKDRIADLIDAGIVVEIDKEFRSGQASGRPASRYAFNTGFGYVVGVELGKHSDRILIADAGGRVIRRSIAPGDEAASAAERLESIAARLASITAELPTPGRFLGLGAAVPGTLTPEGEMLRSAVFPEWAGQNLRAVFERYFAVPIVLENDINAATVAEHRIGAAADVDDLVLALLWHRVAAGVLLNGSLRRGARHRAGELHQLASTRDEEAERLWPSMPDLLLTLESAEGDDTAAASAANASLDRLVQLAAEQIATLALTVDPDLILLHGPAAENPGLVERIRVAVAAHTQPAIDTPIAASGLGQDAPVLGVILAALDALAERNFGDAARPIPRIQL